MPAPIALFCFRRPIHLDRTLGALAANHGAREHDLIAFLDGPRGESDAEGVAAVRQTRDNWAARNAFRSFTVHAQPANLGLHRSLVHGVTKVCQTSGQVIVVEDDLVTSPWFLAFMEDGLGAYAGDSQVASIHGHVEPMDGLPGETFFLRGADCWGWATWHRAWLRYRDDAHDLLAEITARRLGDEFDLKGARALRRMLADADVGLVDSWAIRWHASAFLAGMFTLYPTRSLVSNIGLDGSGTHCRTSEAPTHPCWSQRIPVRPVPIALDPVIMELFLRHFMDRLPRWWLRFGRRLGVLADPG